MSTTLIIELFVPRNIKERARLLGSAGESAPALNLLSTVDYVDSDVVYVASLPIDYCASALWLR